MLLLVTIVSALVHIYTIGYMQGEPGYARFFSYIALFTFSMLMLVLADNFLQLFVFWEAVGLCSYLLDRPLVRTRVGLSPPPPKPSSSIGWETSDSCWACCSSGTTFDSLNYLDRLRQRR